MDRQPYYAAISPISAGVRGRCPRCGRGPLFNGYLGTAKSCSSCDLDYSFADAGDGPAVFIILIVGFIVVGLALVVEISYQPPYWLHAIMWLPLAVGLPLLLLRPAKGILVCQQYSQEAQEGRIDRP